MAIALGVTVLLTPVHTAVAYGFVFAMGSYDNSGSGGPFRSCTADSVSCGGPHYGLMIFCALVFLGCLAVAGLLGQAVGRFGTANRARAGLAALSALLVVVLVILPLP
jgi:hypothetical protein